MRASCPGTGGLPLATTLDTPGPATANDSIAFLSMPTNTPFSCKACSTNSGFTGGSCGSALVVSTKCCRGPLSTRRYWLPGTRSSPAFAFKPSEDNTTCTEICPGSLISSTRILSLLVTSLGSVISASLTYNLRPGPGSSTACRPPPLGSTTITRP